MGEPARFKCQMRCLRFFSKSEGKPGFGVLYPAIRSCPMNSPYPENKISAVLPGPIQGGLLGAVRPVLLVTSLVVSCAAAPSTPQPAQKGEGSEAVAISSRVSSDYVRPRLADGSLQKETFAFAKGGLWRGTEAGTTEMPDFMDVARTIARPLAVQGYLSSRDPETTRLLIMVYWGTTRTPEHTTDSISSQNLQIANAAALAANAPQIARFNPNDSCAPMQVTQASTTSYAIRTPDQIGLDNAMTGAMAMAAAEDEQRNQIDAVNASMLGYDSWWAQTAQFEGTPREYRRRDLMDELEARRYFVVLMAYDFQMMWKEKRAKLLWETRFSIREQGNDFSRQLPAMAGSAAAYFGKDSGNLIHKPLPEGHVEVGTIKELAYSPRN